MHRLVLLCAVLLAPPAFAVLGGTTDPGDPAVVSIVAAGGSRCTGTLVAPDLVLTAGHCVIPAIGPLADLHVAFGTNALAPDRTADIIGQMTHPQYSGEGKPFDFAVLKLAAPVSGVALPLLNADALSTDWIGAAVRHVGFGVTNEATGDGSGTKRDVTYPITQVQSGVIFSGAPGQQTCSGDSGGPAFLKMGADGQERLVAVVSDGPDCNSDGWDGRVDVVMGWLRDVSNGWRPGESGCSVGGLGLAPLGLLAAAAALRRRRGRAGAK